MCNNRDERVGTDDIITVLQPGLAGFCQLVEMFFSMEKTGVAKIVFAGKSRFCHINYEAICQNQDYVKKIKTSYCYTLKVHTFPFTMSLKLSLCAQYQECYDCLHLRHHRELYLHKCP